MKRVIGLVVALVATQLGISVSQGSVVLTEPVPNLKTGNLESTVVDAALNLHDPIYLIREQRLTLGSGLAVDGTPGSPMGGGGTIAAGVEVQSWILHFDMAGRAGECHGFGHLGLRLCDPGADLHRDRAGQHRRTAGEPRHDLSHGGVLPRLERLDGTRGPLVSCQPHDARHRRAAEPRGGLRPDPGPHFDEPD